MSIKELLKKKDFNNSLLIGYYGGGNFGDELLLEVLQNMFKTHGVTKLEVLHQRPADFAIYHHDFGYSPVLMGSKVALLKAILRNKKLVIGGGGLWGLDVNTNTLVLGIILWMSRWMLGKKVYLLGVGYYNSTSRLGHISAWFAGKAANYIVVRDAESLAHFKKYSRSVSLDSDIAWLTKDLDLTAYKPDLRKLEAQIMLPHTGRSLFITLRRFKQQYTNNFTDLIGELIAAHPKKHITVALLEPRQVDPEGFAQISKWAAKHPHVHVIDFDYNPLALLLFFKQHSDQLAYIGPQFHGILTAHLAGVPYLPLVYDNKSQELLDQVNAPTSYSIYDLTSQQLNNFVNEATT